MKVNAIRSYQTNFGNNQNNSQSQNKGITDIIPTSIQPTAGLIPPKTPRPTTPNIYPNQPLAGKIIHPTPNKPTPTTVPAPMSGDIRMPVPTQTPTPILYPPPLAGIISSPNPKTFPPHKPEVTAGLIGHPDSDKQKEEIDKILKKL